MPKKKTINTSKRMTIKEITDAFYSGVSPDKIKEMAQKLVEQENTRIVVEYNRDK